MTTPGQTIQSHLSLPVAAPLVHSLPSALSPFSAQAMAAYRTAARLFPGLHTPLLGMGMEYSGMNNLQLAERMLLTAHRLCPTDPATSHELGVLNYKNGQ